MNMPRSSGVLLHPVSLPETPGIGTIGDQAYKFIDWLSEAHQSLWQILPYGPTGYGDSPYASFSTFAGNPLLIDLQMLVKDGILTKTDITPPEYIKNTGYIDYGSVVWWKKPILRKAAENFIQQLNKNELNSSIKTEYNDFCAENTFWLENYCIFMSIKEFYDDKAQKENKFGARWNNYWPEELAVHQKEAVTNWQTNHIAEIENQKVVQFFFFSQWRKLKSYAASKKIKIIGDTPIFVAADSADVWANQKLFQLDEHGTSTSVAGVPPDYFCATGQLWGNPLYDWDAMEKDNFSWWIERIRYTLKNVDFVRIDHFRGFEAYWSVPATETTAVNGKWVPGPGRKLFDAIKQALGDVPIIAEDLGVITEGVKELRDSLGLPGMKVLQFAFDFNAMRKGDFTNYFLPHEYSPNCVAYTGTHDNDTTCGWLKSLPKEDRDEINRYLAGGKPFKKMTIHTMCDEFIRQAFASTAAFTVVPMQDILRLYSEGRMNKPATAGGHNWQWRMEVNGFESVVYKETERLSELACIYGRNL